MQNINDKLSKIDMDWKVYPGDSTNKTIKEVTRVFLYPSTGVREREETAGDPATPAPLNKKDRVILLVSTFGRSETCPRIERSPYLITISSITIIFVFKV